MADRAPHILEGWADAGERFAYDQLGEGEQNLEGRARFVCDGQTIELGRGELLYARPGVRREAIALESPTMPLILGDRPGEGTRRRSGRATGGATPLTRA
jgi:hypothetical protein